MRHPQPVVPLSVARRRRRLRTAGVLLGVSAVGAVLGWVLLGSGLLGVARVEVVGAGRVPEAQVLRAADVRPGTPMLRVDTAGAARRVLALRPVRAAQVDRVWPRLVRITVRERVAAAVAPRGSGWALVDRTGVDFASVAGRPRGLPVVSAPVDQGPRALRATLDVLDALSPGVRAQVRQVRAASTDRITLQLTRGRSVEWGSAGRSARKAAVLQVLLTRKARVYDVSAPDMPTTSR